MKQSEIIYPCLFLRPCESGSVNLKLTMPSGPKTLVGILSNESDKERVSADCSCKLILRAQYFVSYTNFIGKCDYRKLNFVTEKIH
jgi:hypothetical protein